MTAYDVLMVDPPWPKRKSGARCVRPRQGRALDYSTCSVADIFALLDARVLARAARRHSVFLWTIDEFLHAAEDAMEERHYQRHARFIWDKGTGVAPAFTVRYSHEYLLWFYVPPLLPIAPVARGIFPTVIREGGREHSRKPEGAYALVEALYPAARRLDVFSRAYRVGWDAYGDQRDHFTPLLAPLREQEARA